MGRPFTDPARDAEMIRLFRSGLTTVELAPLFSMTSSGVSTRLRVNNVNRFEGGKSEIKRKMDVVRSMRASFDKAIKFIHKSGANLSSFESIEDMRIANQRFREQRYRARQRKIGWELTFSDWWEIWSESGLWHSRGRKNASSAVMARRGDIGPYSKENVYIITLADNFVESWVSAPDRVNGGRVKHLNRLPVCGG